MSNREPVTRAEVEKAKTEFYRLKDQWEDQQKPISPDELRCALWSINRILDRLVEFARESDPEVASKCGIEEKIPF